MISSPGALYGGGKIDYTTDTSPIKLKWFDLDEEIFLAESSQIYLELSLIQKDTNSVYCVYNSFRKEPTDVTHLPEFHHIEYEGHVNQEENEKIMLNLIKKILSDVIQNNERDLSFFLNNQKIRKLDEIVSRLPNITKLTFFEALRLLNEDTKNPKYKKFTIKDNFGFWEEVRLTNLLEDMVLVKEFPLLEVSFYHSAIMGKTPQVANNSDLIWPGYREIAGSGQRIKSVDELFEKAEVFNLPKEDYEIYLQSRKLPDYKSTSGFGLGWERLLQAYWTCPLFGLYHTSQE